jgi:hypothetical protein
LGRRIALGFALASFLGAVTMLAVFIVMLGRRGAGDVVVASLFASVVFLASCGVVLYFLGKPPRHELLPWDSANPDQPDMGAPGEAGPNGP